MYYVCMIDNKEHTQDCNNADCVKEENRSMRPKSENFKKFIASNWGPRPDELPARNDSADYAVVRRNKISNLLPNQCLIIPAGPLKVRSNDCDYLFRPHTAFAHMTGLGTDQYPDALLALLPTEGGHEHVLYFRPRASRSTEEFYADARYGELWVGVRPSLAEVEAATGITTKDIRDFSADLSKYTDYTIAVVPEADPYVEELVNEIRLVDGKTKADFAQADEKLAEELSTLRLLKDEWEVQQMQHAVNCTKKGFENIIANLPRAVEHWRGERVVEGAFASVSREEGNGVGYETIAASGNHANTLHWIDNNGPVREGDMILVDAGVEVDSLYTADITRTLPVNGKYSPIQREIYQAVLDAADAAFEAANKPGAIFKDMHIAALEVLADRLEKWGVLPVSAVESLLPEGQYHCRWMVHGTSHHLGMDVHDCAKARREMYLEAKLEPGMCFTIEPGLYFREDDLAVPVEFRGNAVRIEDDIIVNPDGTCSYLSKDIPRTIEDVEKWIAEVQSR